jgi:hypothetical protein
MLACEGRDVAGPRGVDARSREARVTEPVRDGLGPARVVVGHDDRLEEVAASRDRGEGAPDTTRADDEDPHGRQCRRWPDAAAAEARVTGP